MLAASGLEDVRGQVWCLSRSRFPPGHLAQDLAPGRHKEGEHKNEPDKSSGDLCSKTWHRVKLETKFL